MVRRWLGAVLGLALSAWPALAQAPRSADVDGARLLHAGAEPGQWLSVGRTYDEQRFSPLKAVDTANVAQLGLAWSADLNTYRGVEGTPLVVDGVLYNTSAWNITTAYDAATGKELWTYDPQVPPQFGRKACCDIVSRGLAVWKGRVLIATLDGRLIALDAHTGKPAWSVDTFKGEPPWAYTITGAPRVFDGKVLIGNGGAEIGARGYVTAYDAGTGRKLWRFYTVPGDPSKGPDHAASDNVMPMAARTWTGEWWKSGGGGTAWDAMVYDPKLKLIYIGVGNGSPWVQKFRSPGGGDNLFLASIVAVRADTGRYVWHYQETPGEQFDSTATQPMILADLKFGARTVPVLMQAPKNGFFYVLDRRTGKLISAEPFAPTTWASRVELKTGRPVENPDARYGETPVLLSPGAGGAHNFNPISYSPQTGLVYFTVVQDFMTFSAAPSFAGGLGTAFAGHDALRRQQAEYANAHVRSWLVAWDPVAARPVWKVNYKRSGSGGTLATAGGLVFQGTSDKTFAAYRATDGRKLWEMQIPSVAIAGPITYTVKGVQYVAVNAGWGGGLAHVQADAFRDLNVAPAKLLVFKLGGTAPMPALKVDEERPPEPPFVRASEAEIAHGGELFAKNCSLCHGQMARGGIKDLRKMSADAQAHFLDIVIGGARAKAGMASFADVLTKADAEAIHNYVNARAREDWGEMRLH